MLARLTGSLCLALGLLPGAAALLSAQPSSATDTLRYEVVSVQVRGASALEPDLILQHIATEPSRCKSLLLLPLCKASRARLVWDKHFLEDRELALDSLRIRALYWQRGYRQANVRPTVQRRRNATARVTFDVEEGPPTSISEVQLIAPDSLLPQHRLPYLILVSTGDPLDLTRLDTMRVRLHAYIWELGYANAAIRVDTSGVARGGPLRIQIDPGELTTVARIQVTGNSKIGARTIRNSLFVRDGDTYRPSAIIRSQRALYESGLFRRATISPVLLGDTAVILVDVTESALREARLGGGFSTIDFLQGEARYTNYNWQGGARRVTLALTVGNVLAPQLNGKFFFRDALDGLDEEERQFLSPTWRASAELRQPWFRSPRNSLLLSSFAQRRSVPGIFVDRSLGFSGVFTREVARSVPVSYGYQFEVTGVEAGDLYFCANFGVCDLPTVNALRDSRRLSPLSVSTSIDRTDDPISATRGWYLRFTGEHASSYTLSDYRYNRIVADAAWFRPAIGRTVLAFHARAGWVRSLGSTSAALGVAESETNLLHPRKRFYAGGSQSVRGFGENQLGPRILTIPPERLTEAGCDIQDDVAICSDAALNDKTALPDTAFTARPLGGNTVLEASLEYRFPIVGKFEGAAFVDAALVGEGRLRDLTQATFAATPGFGIRYRSTAGPIRIDLGYNPFISEDLPVLTEVSVDGRNSIVPVRTLRAADGALVPGTRIFAPARTTGGLLAFLSQFTLHLSIGHAF